MSLGYVLRIDVGGDEIRLDNWERAGQADPERVGGIDRAYAGNQYSSITAEFMVVPLVSGPVSTAEYQAVDAKFAKGAQWPCDGDAFKGRPDVITCSAKVTAEMVPGGLDDSGAPLWIVNLTLFEVDNADTDAAVDTPVYLSQQVSPDDGDMLLASTNGFDDPFPVYDSKTLLDGATIAGSPATNVPASPEVVWRTRPTALGGWAMVSRAWLQSVDFATPDIWAAQDVMMKIYVVRGGADVVEWDTEWSNGNGGFSGGSIEMVATASVYFFEPDDFLRIELYPRAILMPGKTDDGQRQTVSWGNLGAHYGVLYLVGDVLFEAP